MADITNIDLITLSGDNKHETWRVPQHIIGAFLANSCMNAAAAVILAQAGAGDGNAGDDARAVGKAVRDRCTTAGSGFAAAAAAAADAAAPVGITALEVAAAGAAAAAAGDAANIETDTVANIQRDISGIHAGRSTVDVSTLENAKVGIYQYTTAGATRDQITNNTRTGIQAFVYAQTYSNMEKARTGNKVDYNPAIYFNPTTFEIFQIEYEVTGKSRIRDANFVIIDLSGNLSLSNKNTTNLLDIENIYKNLPEEKSQPATANTDFYFATRIKLVATIFDVIHNKLTDTGIMNTQSLALIRSAYSNINIALPGAAAGAGGAFVRLFNDFIINGGIASRDFVFVYDTSKALGSNNIADTELFMHYVDATTVGASVPMNEVILTPADKTKYEAFFKQNLLAESIITISKGGYKVGGTKRRRRRNRKSSKKNGRGRRYSKRIQKKRGKKSRRIRRKSHRK